MNSIVVHYQELALKGKNRPWFMSRLVRNIKNAVAGLDVTSVRALMGRIEIVLGAGASREQVGDRLRRTFGIANFSYAGRTPLDLDVLTAAILRDLDGRTCESFRVSARRGSSQNCTVPPAPRLRRERQDAMIFSGACPFSQRSTQLKDPSRCVCSTRKRQRP